MKNKVKLFIILLLITVLAVNTFSLAASEAKVTADASSTSVKSGDTFDVTVSQEISEGATGFYFTINYDNEILELVDYNSIVKNSWNIMEQKEPSEGTLEVGILFSGEPGNIPTSGSVLKLNFKVKDNYKETKETTITINPSWDDGNAHNNGYIQLTKIEKKIKVNETSNGNTNTNSGNTNTNNENTNSGNTNTNNENTNSENTNTNSESTNTNGGTTNINNTNTSSNSSSSNSTSNNTSRNNTTNNVSNNASRNNTNNNSSTNNASNNTSNNTNTVTNLPKTGSRSVYTLLIVLGLAGIAFASYKGYKKYKDI